MRPTTRSRITRLLICLPPLLVGGAIYLVGTRPDRVVHASPIADQGQDSAAQGKAALPPPPTPCLASSSWVSNPNPPQEIGNGTPVSQQTNCQFYQFSWQWFLALTQPAPAPNSRTRVFEMLPMFIPGKSDQCGDTRTLVRGAEATALGSSMFIRTTKPATPPFRFIFPKDVQQAGDQDVLYDQQKNIVFYNVRFNETECQATSAGFQPGTMELKTSWRRVSAEEAPRYYTVLALVPGVSPIPIRLGLVGFHLVRNTKTHPEFVWATFEHKDNAPLCTKPQKPPAAGWTFLSSACATCLAQNGISGCPQCNFNTATPNTGLTGAPDQVCQAFRDGTGPPTPGNNATNIANVDVMNAQIVGPAGFLTRLPPTHPMAVWKNYVNTGALWTNGGQASTQANQRGSLQLANTTMETFLQSSTNCFSCHGYDPSKPLDVSHIYRELKTPSPTK